MQRFSLLQYVRRATVQIQTRAVDITGAFTRPTPLESQQQERALLDLFARGFLTIDQVMDGLAHYGTSPKSR